MTDSCVGIGFNTEDPEALSELCVEPFQATEDTEKNLRGAGVCLPEDGLYEELFPPLPAFFARIKSEYDSATISFALMPNSS